MAVHVQQQVIDAFAAALRAGVPAVGPGGVFVDRVDPISAADCPALLLEESPRGEAVEPLTLEGEEQRTLELQLSCVVAGGEDYGQRARQLGMQVELALSGQAIGAEALYDLCSGGVQLVTSAIALSGEGREVIAIRTQVWQCIYSINPDRPDVALSF